MNREEKSSKCDYIDPVKEYNITVDNSERPLPKGQSRSRSNDVTVVGC